MTKEDLEFSVSAQWQKFARESPWASFILETATAGGIEYHRRRGSDKVYKKVGDGFQCVSCSSEIQTGRVAHPIHDGPFPLSGSGRYHYEEVPYCPKCEGEPNFHGLPITVR